MFVSPWGKTYGAAGAAVILQSERGAPGDAFDTAGSLADWKRDVAAYAIGNDRLALFISAAFAGTLLDLLGESSGGLHLTGESQSGKTTCAVAAASVWGRGDHGGQIRQWRATANGVEAVAAETSDMILILDELGQADPREIGDVIYMLANGAGKSRAGRTGEARRRQVWRSLFLSTGELSLAAKMGEAGKRAMAGLDVRLISLEADAGAGMGVFQNLHGAGSAKALADHLRTATRKFCGTASRAFLERLAADRAADEIGPQHKIIGMMHHLDEHVPGDADGQVRSVAARFGLIGAAGELAREYGLLPWPMGEALRASAACFDAWLAERGHCGAGEDELAIRQVRAFLELHGSSRFERPGAASETGAGGDAGTAQRVINRAGFVRDGYSTGLQYLVLPEVWRREICAGLDHRRVAKLLAGRGWLMPETSSGRFDKKERISGWSNALRVIVISASILADERD